MLRRDLLQKASGLSATALVAGCSSVTGGLEVTSVQSSSTAMGNIRLGIAVENTASESKSGTLVGQVDIQGGDTYTERQTISVGGDSSNTYTVTIDLPLSRSISGGQYTYDARIE